MLEAKCVFCDLHPDDVLKSISHGVSDPCDSVTQSPERFLRPEARTSPSDKESEYFLGKYRINHQGGTRRFQHAVTE